jgi:C4-dicarboxylate-specific signal transduction histidine kinase
MDLVKKVLNGQPTLACMIMDNCIVYGNRKFNDFFSIESESTQIEIPIMEFNRYIETERGCIQDLLDDFSREPDNKHRVTVKRDNTDYIFDVYVNISYIDEEVTYIVTMLDITELEEMKARELQQTKLASLGQIAMGIAHEINTPLTYIRGNIELMEFDIESMVSSEDDKEYFFNTTKVIKDGVSRIGLIVETMKEYSNKGGDKVAETNLFETIITAFNMIHNRSKYITEIYINGEVLVPNMEISDSIIREINRTRMEQVWVIILNNALDELSSSPHQFSNRFINIDITENSSGRAVVSFKDNGGGISESIIEKIYQPFISGKSQSGMGLGLHIAKKILSDHDSEIVAYNRDGGAVFEITI